MSANSTPWPPPASLRSASTATSHRLKRRPARPDHPARLRPTRRRGRGPHPGPARPNLREVLNLVHELAEQGVGVRTLVAHLVAQCEDSIRLGTALRRELLGRRRYPARNTVDAHMAVGVDDHLAASGPELVERFALLWPRAVRARRQRPGPLRRIKINSGVPYLPRWRIAYLLDVILNRDLWMHRVDLTRATGRPFVIGDHDQQIVAQVIRDLALAWSAAPVRWSSPAARAVRG